MLTALFTSPSPIVDVGKKATKEGSSTTPPITIQLSMSVICNNELIADLLSPSSLTMTNSDAQPISVVSSPLFGPIVNHVIRRELHSV